MALPSRQALCSLLCVFGSLMLLGCVSAVSPGVPHDVGVPLTAPLAPGTYTITSPARLQPCNHTYLTAPRCGSAGGDQPAMVGALETARASMQRWRFDLVPGSTDKYYISNAFRLAAGCSYYLSVQGCSGKQGVDFWGRPPCGAAGTNQQFQLVPTGRVSNEYYIKAVARGDACNEWMSVQGCGGSSLVDMWGATGGNHAFAVSA